MWKPEESEEASEEASMTDLEKVRQWLLSYPKWEEGGVLYVDHTDAVPGNGGLYHYVKNIFGYDCVF